MTIDELNNILIPQGFKASIYFNDEAEDVKFRPTPVDEQVRRLRGAIEGLGLLARQMRSFPVQSQKMIADVCEERMFDEAIKQLGGLFNAHGSDKAQGHDYHRIYAPLLGPIRNDPLNILEIGLGTNNIDVQSNMGKDGRPGASLRAFRDWLPNARIYGADIDERILFSEERIMTYHVDQTNRLSLRGLAARFEPHSFDLIIDDGLHTPEANINTVNFALGLLKDNGVLVVEDIGEEFFEFWYTALAILSAHYTCHFITAKAGCLVVIGRQLKK